MPSPELTCEEKILMACKKQRELCADQFNKYDIIAIFDGTKQVGKKIVLIHIRSVILNAPDPKLKTDYVTPEERRLDVSS